MFMFHFSFGVMTVISSVIKRSLCVVLALGIVIPVGCKLTHGDTEFEILPADEPAIPPDAVPVGEYTDPFGDKHKLWDINGDGKADLAESASGELKWIKPVTPSTPGSGFTSFPAPGSGRALTVTSQALSRGGYQLLDSPPENPEDITFQFTAEQYLAATGLGQMGFPGPISVSDTLEPLAFDEGNSVGPETMTLDFLVHLAPKFGIPSMWDYPGLKHQANWTLDAAGNPAFMTMQVQGPLPQAIALLAELNYGGGSGTYELDNFPGVALNYSIVFDDVAKEATVTADGTMLVVPYFDTTL